MQTMQVAEPIVETLADIGVARIAFVVLVRRVGRVIVTDRLIGIRMRDFICDNTDEQVQWLDGHWCSIESRSGYVSFEVHLKS